MTDLGEPQAMASTKKHDHGVTSNSDCVFETFKGCTVQGYVTKNETRTLIFKCGWGITFKSNGAFWVEKPSEIALFIEDILKVVRASGAEAERLLKIAGSCVEGKPWLT